MTDYYAYKKMSWGDFWKRPEVRKANRPARLKVSGVDRWKLCIGIKRRWAGFGPLLTKNWVLMVRGYIDLKTSRLYVEKWPGGVRPLIWISAV